MQIKKIDIKERCKNETFIRKSQSFIATFNKLPIAD